MIRGQGGLCASLLLGLFAGSSVAQSTSGTSQTASVGPRGAQVITSTGPAVQGGGAGTQASTTSSGRRWRHASGVENWYGRRVSLGDRGTQVFTELGAGYPARLFSGHDQDPPSPIWQVLDGPIEYSHQIASSELSDLHLSLYQVSVGGGLRRVEVRRFTTAGPSPIVYVHPSQTNGHEAATVRLSRDGRKAVVAVHDIFLNRLNVAVVDTATMTQTALHAVNTSGFFRFLEISADARLLYTASDLAVRVFDLTTGAQVFNDYPPGGAVFGAHGISADGHWLAYGAYNKVRVFERNANGSYGLAFEPTLAGPNYCDRLAFSDDGSTLAAAFNFYDQWLRVDLLGVDLPSRATTMHASVVGQGSLQNAVSDVDVSADGSTIALGLWGDQLGWAPEVLVYRRDQNQPIATWDLPGSALDLDLSSDGAHLAVASKAVHANQNGTGGSIDLYDTRPVDLDATGLPRPGSTLRFEIRGGPNSAAYLLVSPDAAPRPVFLGGIGLLYLQRVGLTRIPAGTTDAQGRAQVSFVLPAGSSGQEYFFQGYTTSPRRLTTDWTKVTVGN